MVASFVETNLFIKRAQLAVDSGADEAVASELRDLFFEFAFATAHDGRENHHPLAFRKTQDALQYLIDALTGDRLTALGTMRLSDRRKQQTQVIVDFSYCSDGRARTAGDGFLFDRDGRRQSFD